MTGTQTAPRARRSCTWQAGTPTSHGPGNAAGTVLTRFSYTYTKPGTTTDTALRHSVTDKDANTTA